MCDEVISQGCHAEESVPRMKEHMGVQQSPCRVLVSWDVHPEERTCVRAGKYREEMLILG